MPSIEIKDFNALIDNKPFFDQPEKRLKISSKCPGVMTGNLLDYSYDHNYCKLIGIYLLGRTNTANKYKQIS